LSCEDERERNYEYEKVGADIKDGLNYAVIEVVCALRIGNGQGPVLLKRSAENEEVGDFSCEEAEESIAGDNFDIDVVPCFASRQKFRGLIILSDI
jgi:hypothetical protein